MCVKCKTTTGLFDHGALNVLESALLVARGGYDLTRHHGQVDVGAAAKPRLSREAPPERLPKVLAQAHVHDRVDGRVGVGQKVGDPLDL